MNGPTAYPQFGATQFHQASQQLPQPQYPGFNAYQAPVQQFDQRPYQVMGYQQAGNQQQPPYNPSQFTQQQYQGPQSYAPQTAAATLKNLNPKGMMRTVYCPLEIVESFIQLAQENTARKLETCAILAGNEKNDALMIDTLIIPKQEGHQDHCFMTDEIELFEAQINNNVMTIGWIHTHPQYSLFLSSVDLHNQLGYQQQMPEAVAIVYSPIEQERYKAFRVKDTRVSEIQKCQKSGFHEHKDEYGRFAWEECSHLQYINGQQNGIRINRIDLRK